MMATNNHNVLITLFVLIGLIACGMSGDVNTNQKDIDHGILDEDFVGSDQQPEKRFYSGKWQQLFDAVDDYGGRD